jgi:hypothetical protein
MLAGAFLRQGVLEQTVEGWERFLPTVLLKLNDPRPDRFGPSVWAGGGFDRGLNFLSFTFPILDQFDCWLCVHSVLLNMRVNMRFRVNNEG